MSALDTRRKTEFARQSFCTGEANKIVEAADKEAVQGKTELFWCKNISNSTLAYLHDNGYITYHSLTFGTIYLSKITW